MPGPLTYLAAPYAHPDLAVRLRRFEAVNRVAAALMACGEMVFSPISHCHPIAEAGALPHGWNFWQRYDRTVIGCCRRVVVLKLAGWRESVGVRPAVLVLCGAKVCLAFGRGFTPFLIERDTGLGRIIVILPHPSGLSRHWNEPRAYRRAREVLRAAGCPVGDEP